MQQPREVFLQRRRARRAHAHQGDAASGDLLFRLNEVAAVHKQRRFLFADDQRARRSGKAGKPLTRLEMVGNIFRSMAVRRRHDDRSKVFILHPRPKRGDFFRNLHRKSLRLSVMALLYTYNTVSGKTLFGALPQVRETRIVAVPAPCDFRFPPCCFPHSGRMAPIPLIP